MTPEERRRVEELFERLAALETNPREPDAEQTIMAGLRKAPHATYALVQTVLLQEEALRNADERIRELEGGYGGEPQQQGGFLDSMRDAIFGGGQPQRGSVPSVGAGGRPIDRPTDRPMGVPGGFRTGEQYQTQGAPGGYQQQPEPSRGGSFLGTAAAAAVGVIGGTMLMNSMRNMLGSNHPANATPSAAADQGGANPWSGGDAAQSDLARQAGLDHVGQSGRSDQSAGLYDHSEGSDQYDTADAGDDDFDMDFGDMDV